MDNVHNQMAKGGFVGKGEMVWKKISSAEKMNFLIKECREITDRSKETLVGKSWNFLPKNVKIKFEAKYSNMEEYAKGGAFKPYGKTKGKYTIEYFADGMKQKEIWETKEMAIDNAKRYSKIPDSDFKNIKIYDENGAEIKYAKGGKLKPKMVRTQFEEEEFEYGKGGNISEGQMKILNALAGYNNGRNLNGILEGMFLSDFKSNKYATEAQTNTVKKNLNSLIKKGFVEEEGLGYSITQEGANYRRSNMAKGGKTASSKPKMVRTQFEEEEFEYGNGGLLSGFNYSIGGL